MAKWIQIRSSVPLKRTEAISAAEVRATRAITHETRQLAHNGMYMPPHRCNSVCDHLLRGPVEVAKRHRFFSITLPIIPTAMGHENLEDLIALDCREQNLP